MVVFHPLRVFLPISLAIGALGACNLAYDLWHVNITDFSLLAVSTSLLLFFFGLLADQIARLRLEIRTPQTDDRGRCHAINNERPPEGRSESAASPPREAVG